MLIIKHLENPDDRGVIFGIQENVYMQYFVGLKRFTVDPVTVHNVSGAIKCIPFFSKFGR